MKKFRYFTGVLVAGLLLGAWGNALAQTTLVTDRTTLAGADFVDWGDLGPVSTAVPHPFNIVSDGGVMLTVTKNQGGDFERRDQGGGWSGNFASGDHLLWTQNSTDTDPVTLFDFDSCNGVRAAGAQFQPDIFGTFVARIEAFNAGGVSLGSYTVPGVSTSAGDNSAIFIGITSVQPIDKVVFSLESSDPPVDDFAINQFDFTIANSPPMADAGADQSVDCTALPVTLDGSGSYDPDGALYAIDGSGFNESTLYELAPTTAAILETIGATGVAAHMTGLAEDPITGILYGVSHDSWNGTLYSVDPATGIATPIGGPVGWGISDIAFSPAGTLYGVDGAYEDVIVTIDLVTGIGTSLGDHDMYIAQAGIAFDTSGRLLLKHTDSLFEVNTSNGLAVYLGTLPPTTSGPYRNVLATDPVTGLMYTAEHLGKGSLISPEVYSFAPPVFTSAAITNASFEDPDKADGTWTSNSIPGWTGQEVVGTAGNYGVWDPGATQAGCGGAFSAGIPDGDQIGFSNGTDVYQDTGMVITEGHTYVLKIGIGGRCGGTGLSAYTLSLNNAVDDATLGAVSGAASAGAWSDEWVAYTSPPGDPNAGDALRIRVTNHDNAQLNWDNVRLEDNAPAGTPTLVGFGPGGLTALAFSGHDYIASYLWEKDAAFISNAISTDVSPAVGSHTYTLTVFDNCGADDSDDVGVTVINISPTADDQGPLSFTEDSVDNPITLTGTDPCGDGPLTYDVTSGPGFGSLDTLVGPDVKYTPNADYFGPDSFTFTITDGNGGVSNTATISITVTPVNDNPVINISRVTATVQYSDTIGTVTITATDVDDDPLVLTSEYLDDGAGPTAGLPSALGTVGGCTAVPNDTTSDGTTCSWDLTGQMLEDEGDYDITFTVTDGGGGTGGSSLTASGDTEIIVDPEDATISFDTGNDVAVMVDGDGSDSSLPFSLTVYIEETEPDLATYGPLSGDLSLAVPHMVLTPVGPGGPVDPVSCDAASVAGVDYAQVMTYTCHFSGVPVNTYSVDVTVDGGYYIGENDDVLTVYDPSLGFTTGGGWFYWPGSDDKTNFGYTMKYNKKWTKVQGSLLLIRHLSDGTSYRIKSNAIHGLALGSDPEFGWASFSGKATYRIPNGENDGNHEFTVYVEDHGVPGGGVDQVWIETRDKQDDVIPVMSMDFPAYPDNTETLQKGNIVVPQSGGGTGKGKP